MIHIYKPNNTNFENNGDMTLFPSMCNVVAELGGSWILNITHPIDKEGRWKYIINEAVLSVPTFMGKKQLFRIEKIDDKNITEISAIAYPIFFDSGDDCFLFDTRPTGKNGQEALNEMMQGSKYSGSSNITKAGTAYFIRRNLMNAINGGSPSFTEIWGGEPLYDNFCIILNERAGGDYGAEVRYGMNMEEISVQEDYSEVVTRIVPVAYNGYTYTGKYIDSPLINKYAKIYTKEIRFDDIKMRDDASEDDEENGVIICYDQKELDDAFRLKCQEQFEQGLDKYKVNMSIDMIELEDTEEYKDFSDLVKVSLGDTVHCINKEIGVDITTRSIKVVWDCIEDKIQSVELGDFKANALKEYDNAVDKINGVVRPDGTVMADRVQGILDGIYTQLRLQSTAAKKVDGVAFKTEDLDPESPLYGCMIWGTQGIQISVTRTADGRDWDWTTAITAKGIVADSIITGILSDKGGKNYWNLDTGEFRLSSEAFLVDEESLNDYVGTIIKGNMTQEQIFRALTDNGRIQGIFMKNGQLYINGRYIEANSIRISSLAGSDYSNLVTVTETDESTMLPTSVLGGTKRWKPDSGIWEIQRYDYTKSENLPLCDFTPNRLQNGDRISCDFDVYLIDTYAVKDVDIWFYDENKSYVHTNYTTFTSGSERWETKHIEIEIKNMPNNAAYYIVGLNFHNKTKNDVVRKCRFLPMIGGNLIVDQAITAKKIKVDDLKSLNATIADWHIENDYLWTQISPNSYAIIKSTGDVMIAVNSPTKEDTTGATWQLFFDGHTAFGDTKNGKTRSEMYGDRWNMYNDQGFAFRVISAGGVEIYGDPNQNKTPYWDWHYNGDPGDYSVRFVCTGYDTVEVQGGTLNNSSDESLKEDISEFDKKMETFFKNVNPIYYRYKTGNTKKQFGYSANNIEEALIVAGFDPKDIGLYSVDEKGLRSLAIGGMDAPNTYMIKLLLNRVLELEKEMIEVKMRGV